MRAFLIAVAAACAHTGQTTPSGYYNLERMLQGVHKRGGDIGACGTFMDARGLNDADLLYGVHRSTMDELAHWVQEADRTITF